MGGEWCVGCQARPPRPRASLCDLCERDIPVGGPVLEVVEARDIPRRLPPNEAFVEAAGRLFCLVIENRPRADVLKEVENMLFGDDDS